MASRRQKPVSLPGCPVESSDGLDALEKSHRTMLNLAGLVALESVDVDESFRKLEPNSSRWDYYIGLKKAGEIYLEVHEVSEQSLGRIEKKAEWLRAKITDLAWPETAGRPLLVAPTKGISPAAVFGELTRRLAMQKIAIVMRGTRIADILE